MSLLMATPSASRNGQRWYPTSSVQENRLSRRTSKRSKDHTKKRIPFLSEEEEGEDPSDEEECKIVDEEEDDSESLSTSSDLGRSRYPPRVSPVHRATVPSRSMREPYGLSERTPSSRRSRSGTIPNRPSSDATLEAILDLVSHFPPLIFSLLIFEDF